MGKNTISKIIKLLLIYIISFNIVANKTVADEAGEAGGDSPYAPIEVEYEDRCKDPNVYIECDQENVADLRECLDSKMNAVNNCKSHFRRKIDKIKKHKKKAIRSFKKGIKKKLKEKLAKLGEENQALASELVERRYNKINIERITRNYLDELRKITSSYAQFIKQFLLFKDTHQTLVDDLKRLSTAASNADIVNLNDLMLSVARVWDNEMINLFELRNDAIDLKTSFQSIQLTYDSQIAEFRDFISQHKLRIPNETQTPITSLENIIIYTKDRQKSVAATCNKLIHDMKERQRSLIKYKSDLETQDVIKSADDLFSAAQFLQMVQEKIQSIWQVPRSSEKTGFYYLKDQYTKMQSFIDLQVLCQDLKKEQSKWRYTGCKFLEREISKVRNYQSSTVPSLIDIGIQTLQPKASKNQRTLMGKIRKALDEKDLLLAVSDFDLLLELEDSK